MPKTKAFYAIAVSAAAACAAPEGVQHDKEKIARTVKPGAAVSFSHSLRDVVEPGDNGVLELTIAESYDAGAIELIAASDGLDLAATSQSLNVSAAGTAQHRWDVFFDAPNGGVHYIDFTATVTDENGVTVSRAYSAAVSVGAGAVVAKPDAPFTIDADGEPVMIMQAEETIEE